MKLVYRKLDYFFLISGPTEQVVCMKIIDMKGHSFSLLATRTKQIV